MHKNAISIKANPIHNPKTIKTQTGMKHMPQSTILCKSCHFGPCMTVIQILHILKFIYFFLLAIASHIWVCANRVISRQFPQFYETRSNFAGNSCLFMIYTNLQQFGGHFFIKWNTVLFQHTCDVILHLLIRFRLIKPSDGRQPLTSLPILELAVLHRIKNVI